MKMDFNLGLKIFFGLVLFALFVKVVTYDGGSSYNTNYDSNQYELNQNVNLLQDVNSDEWGN